jgi:predicted porin
MLSLRSGMKMHSSHFRIPAVTAAVLLASGISGAASAANVELYGSIDNGLRVTAARGIDGASSQTTVGMESGQWFPNLIGLKGSESLGNGYSVAFSLENRFNSDSGTFLEEGRLFDNQALLMVNTEK